MKLVDNFCTCEQSIKLTKLGIVPKPDNSLGYWCLEDDKYYFTTLYLQSDWPAFTVAELGVMLPPGFDTMYCTNEGWRGYDPNGNDFKLIAYKTEAELRAEMVIALLEQNPDYLQQANWRLTGK